MLIWGDINCFYRQESHKKKKKITTLYGNARGCPALEYLDDRKSVLDTENSTQKRVIGNSIQIIFFFTEFKRIWLQSIYAWFEIIIRSIGTDCLYEKARTHFLFFEEVWKMLTQLIPKKPVQGKLWLTSTIS